MLELLRSYLSDGVGYLQFLLELISIICILIGLFKTVIAMIRLRSGGEKIRLIFGRWLAMALEFQLAADILITTIEPDFESLIRLVVIAVIRTFLNYFLSKELTNETKKTSSSTSKDDKDH